MMKTTIAAVFKFSNLITLFSLLLCILFETNDFHTVIQWLWYILPFIKLISDINQNMRNFFLKKETKFCCKNIKNDFQYDLLHSTYIILSLDYQFRKELFFWRKFTKLAVVQQWEQLRHYYYVPATPLQCHYNVRNSNNYDAQYRVKLRSKPFIFHILATFLKKSSNLSHM